MDHYLSKRFLRCLQIVVNLVSKLYAEKLRFVFAQQSIELLISIEALTVEQRMYKKNKERGQDLSGSAIVYVHRLCSVDQFKLQVQDNNSHKIALRKLRNKMGQPAQCDTVYVSYGI